MTKKQGEKFSGEAAIAAAIEGATKVVNLTPLNYNHDKELELSRLPRNDYGNGQRVILRFGADLLFVQGIGWCVWDGKRFARDSGESLAQIKAQQTALKIRFEAKAIKDEGPWVDEEKTREAGETVYGETRAAFADRLKDHRGWSVTSGNSGRLKNMLGEAAPHKLALPDQLDTGLRLFNVSNGTLAIQPEQEGGVRLRRASRKDLITCVSPVRYDPRATAPLFHKFLRRMVPDANVRDFLQRWFGYCLTGETGEQALCLFYGEGANGKGTLVNLVSYILGDYAKTLDFSSLAKDDRKRGGEARPDIAKLPGSRFVSAGEPEQGTVFSEGLIKSMTGEDPITCRHLNKDQFEYMPRFKITLLMNLLPTIIGQDEGIWRRFMLVPFEQSVPKGERNKDLPKILKGEAAGVLNWMLEGALEWIEHGLCPPEAVLAATKMYREDSDPTGAFMKEYTTKVPGSEVQAGQLYGAYVRYCSENSIAIKKEAAFGRYMTGKGYKKRRSGFVFYLGLELTPEAHSIGQKTAQDYGEEVNS